MKKIKTVYDINECVIFHKMENGKSFIGKNRDRTYFSSISVERSSYNDIEIVVIVDQDTMWMEGMNSMGMGITNSALLVGFDEKAKKLAKKNSVTSKDGIIIREALKMNNIESAMTCLRYHMGGVRGHTIISNRDSVYTIESSTYHDSITSKKESSIGIVRTNHGHEFSGIIGYTSGDDFISSILRKDQMGRNIRDRNHDDKWFDTMTKSNYDKNSPYNIRRDTDKMNTTNQLLMNLHDLEFHINMINDKGEFNEFVDLSPDIDRKIKLFIHDNNKIKEI